MIYKFRLLQLEPSTAGGCGVRCRFVYTTNCVWLLGVIVCAVVVAGPLQGICGINVLKNKYLPWLVFAPVELSSRQW